MLSMQLPVEDPREHALSKEYRGLNVRHETVNGINQAYLEYGNTDKNDPNVVTIVLIHGWLGANAAGQVTIARALAGNYNPAPQDEGGDASQGAINVRTALDELEERGIANAPLRATALPPIGITNPYNFSALEGKYRIIIPALPGTDITPALRDPSLENMAEHLVLFMEALGIENAGIFGTSMGAILASHISANHPEKVKFMVLQGFPASAAYMNRSMYLAGHILSMAIFSPLIRPMYVKLFERIMGGGKDFETMSEALREKTLKRIKQANWRTVRVTLHGIGKNLKRVLGRINVPVALVDGRDADLVPADEMKEIAGMFKGPTAVYKVGSESTGRQGHSLPETFPEFIAWLIAKTDHNTDIMRASHIRASL